MRFMKRKSYPSDLSAEEWKKLKSHIPKSGRGAPRRGNLRKVINALRYLARTGCQWRLLPHDLPPWEVVYYYFSHWRDDGFWERLNRELRIEIRISVEKDPEPCCDFGQPIGLVEGDERIPLLRCWQKINGIKRHLLVDALGLVLIVLVLTANLQDRDGSSARCSKRRKGVFRVSRKSGSMAAMRVH